MAGGKETPRQKMIGMMYLVLTALLALNVSKTILDAFVAIEENMQIANINEYTRGQEKYDLIKEKAEGKESTPKAVEIAKLAKKIDEMTAQRIQLIDKVKLLVMMECKEEIKAGTPKDEAIIVKDRGRENLEVNLDSKNPGFKNNAIPVLPVRMNLHHVSGKDKYDEGMRVIGIASSEALVTPDPKGSGMEIWNSKNAFKNELCQLICEAGTNIAKKDTIKDKKGNVVKFSFTDPKIKKYTDKEDLLKQLTVALNPLMVDGASTPELESIRDIYTGLTKNEMVMEGEKELHWIGKTFDHAPQVATIASLTSLQKEILTARATALSYLQEKIGAGQYSFNKVQAFAFADQMVVNANEQFTVNVLMAAFDTEKQPLVKPNQGSLAGPPKNGVATLKLTAPASGTMEITGTVTIRKKDNTEKTEPYTAKIAVMPPMATVTLPEFSIMYSGYQNKVTAVAGGSKGESDIQCLGAVKVKQSFTVNGSKYNGWLVKPSPGSRTVVVSVYGKDSEQKQKKFGDFKYAVKPFPSPKCLTPSISKASGARITVGLGQDCPIQGATFTIKGGTVLVGDGIPYSGPVIPAAAVKAAKVGKTVGITINCTNSLTGQSEIITGSLTVKQ